MIRFWTILSRFIAAVIRVLAQVQKDPLVLPTNDAVLEHLVAPDRITITLALVFFTIEILNRLIVQ
jgi:hypothetical protein